MSKEREHIQVDTSANAKMDKPQFPDDRKEEIPGLPVKIPLSILRWLCYTGAMGCFLSAFHLPLWQWINGALILGHFSSQLNAIIKK